MLFIERSFARLGYIDLIWSDFIEEELRRVTLRIGWRDYSTVKLLAEMTHVAELVTANTKDFPPKKRFANITIITPDAFLHLLNI